MAKADTNSGFRFYVPEVHDVYPGMEARLDALYGAWPTNAAPHVATLIVPDWQSRFPLVHSTEFVSRIAALPGEKILHGFTHSLGPDFWNWLLYGHDNRSEFAALDSNEAASRIAAGIDSFKAHFGAVPRWFCAPRWQQSKAAISALKNAGFENYMVRGALRSFSGHEAQLPSLCFDEGERKIRSAIARNLREFSINRLFAAGQPFRVTLHPNDVDDAAAWRQVKRVMARLDDEGWTPIGPDEALVRFSNRIASRK